MLSVGVAEIVVRLVLALALGVVIALTYRRAHQSFAYAYGMVAAMVLLSMTVCLVLMVVDNSLARAFGLVGALSMIRFRMPIKDVRDILFLFLSLVAGITCGVGGYRIAGIGVPAICAVAAVLFATGWGGVRRGGRLLLRLRLRAGADPAYDAVLRRHCASYSMVEYRVAKERGGEALFGVALADPARLQDLTRELSLVEGIEQVVALQAAENPDSASS